MENIIQEYIQIIYEQKLYGICMHLGSSKAFMLLEFGPNSKECGSLTSWSYRSHYLCKIVLEPQTPSSPENISDNIDMEIF